MILPTIHRNGTSAVELLAQIRMAADVLSLAIRKLEEAHPNARDYYPQGANAYPIAVREHQTRIQCLMSVRQELEEIAEGILTQQNLDG